MVRFTEPLGAQYGVRAICGKGGFPDEAIEPMQRLGMVYFAIVGGAAALETTQIEEIEEVAWEELMPECLWKFRVKDFGPLTVGIDAHGNSLYHDVQARAQEKLKELYARFDVPALGGLTHVIDKGSRASARAPGRTCSRRHGRRLRRHRQARLGHVVRDPNLDRKLDVLGESRSSSAARSSRPSTRRTSSTSTSAGCEQLGSRTSRSRTAPSRSRASEARADRRLRARLHRALRGRLEGLRGRLRRRPVGAVDQGGARRRRLEGDHGGARGRHGRDLPLDRRDADRPRRRDRARDRRRDLVFEAPTKAAQAWFVKHFGPEVNLGNIPPDEVIPLETLRLGLRGDTLKEVLLGDRAGTPLPDLDFEAMSAEELLLWAYEEFGERMCLTCSWQRQSSVLVHMVSELGLDIAVVELDTQLFFRETYETRDRLVERYGPRALCAPS